jgi:hypothetical protein
MAWLFLCGTLKLIKMKPSVEETINQYITARNEQDADKVTAGFAKCWAPEGTYTDPNFALVEGVEGIAGLAIGSLEKVPGRTFSIVIAPEYHHNVGRYTWQINLPDGKSREGFDYFEFNEGYLITRIVSFFKPL